MTAEEWKCLKSSPCFQRFERSAAIERLERFEQLEVVSLFPRCKKLRSSLDNPKQSADPAVYANKG